MAPSIIEIPTSDVFPNPAHYREVKASHVKELAAAIKASGFFEPITVWANGDAYIIDSGHHRHAAALLLKRKTIPAIVAVADHKTMVAANLHFVESEIERSRGTQLLLADGVRPVDVAAMTGEKQDRVSKAAKGVKLAGDKAEQLTVDRLAALAEFETDEKAVEKILAADEAKWARVYDELKRAAAMKVAVEAKKAIVKAAGVKLISGTRMDQHHYLATGDEMPEGAKYARVTEQHWNGSAAITWYDDVAETDDLEAPAKREAAEARRAELALAKERRIAFVGEHLSTSQGLVELARALWDDDTYAQKSDGEAFGEVEGFLDSVMASLLAGLDEAVHYTLEAMGGHSADYRVRNNGADLIAYYATLDALGFEPSPAESSGIKVVAEELAKLDEPEPDFEDDDESEPEAPASLGVQWQPPTGTDTATGEQSATWDHGARTGTMLIRQTVNAFSKPVFELYIDGEQLGEFHRSTFELARIQAEKSLLNHLTGVDESPDRQSAAAGDGEVVKP